MRIFIDKWFGVSASGATFTSELRAGITTFFAMAYILFVNPQILAPAIVSAGAENMPAQLLSATAISAAIGSILMGVIARMPIALAPGMGLNAYFTYTVVLEQGFSWQAGLGAVFVSGIIFLILSLSGLREAIVNAIPISIKRASAAGIGMFLAFLGCQSGGIVVANPATLVGLGDLTSAAAILTICGLVVTAALMIRKVPGAILIGIAGITSAAVFFELPLYQGKPFSGFDADSGQSFLSGIMRMPVMPMDLVGALDIKTAMELGSAGVVFTFLFVAFFDTAGTLMGLSEIANFTDKEGRIHRAGQAFATDAIATSIGAFVGTSTTTAYMESAAGIEDGGKTGIVAVVTGVLFLIALFFWPLASVVPSVATAPALILMGVLLMESVGKIEWHDFRVSVPAFVTMIGMPLTYSIANGISLGILSHVLISLCANRMREVHPVMYGLVVAMVGKYMWKIFFS